MNKYSLIGVSVKGEKHITTNTPNEDCALKYQDETCKIFVLGDGHGQDSSFRSNLGSQFICEIAVSKLKEFAHNFDFNTYNLNSLSEHNKEIIMRHLITSIFQSWNEKVETHFEENRPKMFSSEKNLWNKDKPISHIYGTTFIAGLLVKNFLIVLHQGDGVSTIFDKKGNPHLSVEADSRCFNNVTTSVCDVDAIERCRYNIINLDNEDIMACILTSDGLEDCFASTRFYHCEVAEILTKLTEMSSDDFEEQLRKDLVEYSKLGSHDDISFCGIVNLNILNKEKDSILIKNKIANLTYKKEIATSNLKSIQRKYEILKDEHSKFEKNYTSAFNSLMRSKQELVNSINHISAKELIDVNNVSKNVLNNLSIQIQNNLQNKIQALTDMLEDFHKIFKEYKNDTERLDLLDKNTCKENYLSVQKQRQEYIETIEQTNIELDKLKNEIGTISDETN